MHLPRRDICTYIWSRNSQLQEFENYSLPCMGTKEENTGKKMMPRASLVAQWLRIHLPMQGTRVGSLVQEDPTCRGATKPMHHNY